jgi:hypothetical protein
MNYSTSPIYTFILLTLLLIQGEDKPKNDMGNRASYLLSLGNDYIKTEAIPIPYQGYTLHLYPTESVKSIYQSYLSQSKDNPELNFAAYVIKEGILERLALEEDTTCYLPTNASKQYELQCRGNRLLLAGKPLATGKFIFVIDKNEKFFIAKKTARGEKGRIQHSSFSRGKPVIAAGTITLEQDGMIVLGNYSGHYMPRPDNLKVVVKWLKRNGYDFKVISDTIDEQKRQLRTIELIPK